MGDTLDQPETLNPTETLKLVYGLGANPQTSFRVSGWFGGWGTAGYETRPAFVSGVGLRIQTKPYSWSRG